jgi:hypothetical protein
MNEAQGEDEPAEPARATVIGGTEQSVRRNRRTNRQLLAMVAATCVAMIGLLLGGLEKFDQKLSHTERTVTDIRDAQVANIARNDALAMCELDGFDKVLVAAGLALNGDRNPGDYPRAVQCKALTPASLHKHGPS